MFSVKNNLLISTFLLLSTQAYHANAFSFRHSFRDMFEEMDHAFRNMRDGLGSRFYSQEKLSIEDQDLVNKQLELVNKIKPEITKNDNGLISIVFPIDAIKKEKIELSLEHGLLHGIMPLEHGSFRFIVSPKYITCEYLIELTKEVTEELPAEATKARDNKEKDNQDKEEAYHHTMAWRTSNSFTEALPLEADLSKVQSETRNNKLVIKIEPKSYTRLKIRHS